MALVVWLAQQAEGGARWPWPCGAAHRGRGAARESEHRLFQFLDVMPVGVFIASHGGHPYYVNGERQRAWPWLPPGVGGGELSEIYGVSGRPDQLCPAEAAIVRALDGHASHVENLEIREPDGAEIPLEVSGCPVYGADGQVHDGIAAFADTSRRDSGKKPSRARPRCWNWPTTRSSSGPLTVTSRTGARVPRTPTALPAPRRSAAKPTICSAPSSPSRGPPSRPPWAGMAAGTANFHRRADGRPSSWRAAGRRSAGRAGQWWIHGDQP